MEPLKLKLVSLLKKIEYEIIQNPFDLNSFGNKTEIDSIFTKFTDIILEAANLSIRIKTYNNIKNQSHGGIKNGVIKEGNKIYKKKPKPF